MRVAPGPMLICSGSMVLLLLLELVQEEVRVKVFVFDVSLTPISVKNVLISDLARDRGAGCLLQEEWSRALAIACILDIMHSTENINK